MKNSILLILVSILIVDSAKCQQDISLSMYNFNPLYVNPATAGYRDKCELGGIYRYQWVGIEGAPQSGALSYQTPLKNDNLAIGALVKFDKLGLMTNAGLDLSFAYRIPLNADKSTRLSLGIMGSLFNLNDRRRSDGRYVNQNDPTIVDFSVYLPNFGAGAYLYSKRYFVGLSVPHMLNPRINNVGLDTAGKVWSKIYNHYFASAGYVFGTENGIKFKPTVFFKASPNSTVNIDVTGNVLFQERFWVGLGYRFGGDVISEAGQFKQWDGVRGESLIATLKMLVTQRMELGYAYDFPLSRLSTSTSGSHELYLGYDLCPPKGSALRFVSPRYVNYF
jgi:type IX secretion system PorP/SprF family membrane protein